MIVEHIRSDHAWTLYMRDDISKEMAFMRKKLLDGLTVAVLTLGLSGFAVPPLAYGDTEPTRAGGGGNIDPFSFYASSLATLGFRADSCDEPAQGQVNFHDNTVSPNVRLCAEVDDVALCTVNGDDCGSCLVGEVIINATYTSHNPSDPGEGGLTACLGTNTLVSITSGLFGGYSVDGPLSGNVQRRATIETVDRADVSISGVFPLDAIRRYRVRATTSR
jgi:hypothetical protein